jgi:hypothetical protein
VTWWRSRGGLVVRVVIGLLLGAVAGLIGGTLIYRWLLQATGGSEGFEDLVGFVAALYTTLPVGAVSGGLIGAGPEVAAWWRRLGPTRRRATIIGAVAGVLVPLAALLSWDPLFALAAAVIGLPVGALLGFGIGALLGR